MLNDQNHSSDEISVESLIGSSDEMPCYEMFPNKTKHIVQSKQIIMQAQKTWLLVYLFIYLLS